MRLSVAFIQSYVVFQPNRGSVSIKSGRNRNTRPRCNRHHPNRGSRPKYGMTNLEGKRLEFNVDVLNGTRNG